MAPDECLVSNRKRSRENEDEPLFPRGGGSVLTPLEHKHIHNQARRDVLFEQEGNEISRTHEQKEAKINKRRRTNSKSKNKRETIVPLEPHESNPKIESLNYKRLVTGSLVLGQVFEISESEVALSLPNNLTGYVPITSISDKLTNRVEVTSALKEDKNEENSTDEISLQSIFKIGQYLRAYVVSTSKALGASSIGKNKRSIQLSLHPQNTNHSLDAKSISVNSTIMASVVSVEDHGIVLDLGTQDTSIRGFMSSKEIGSELKLAEIQEGTLLFCIVTGISSNGKIVKLSANQERIGDFNKNFVSDLQTIDTLLPGTVIETVITEVNERGIIGKVMGMVNVTADLIHSGAGYSERQIQEIYKVGSKLKARIICTFPQAEYPKLGISILSHILSFRQKQTTINGEKNDQLALLPLSSIIEKVIITNFVPKVGIFAQVDANEIPGFVHISRISDKKIDRLSATSGPYMKGSIHRGRIIGFNSMDRIYILSLQPSILEQPFLRIEDLEVGSTVQGKVERLIMNTSGISGIIVNLADGISGLVPQAHISDVKLLHPEKKIREGDKVNARILSTDFINRQVRLTLKKSLVNSDATKFLCYHDIKPRMQSLGTIIKIMSNGAIVQFYGNVRGFLAVSEMSEAFIEDPSQYFLIGQVVNVYVLDIDPDLERMSVSCKDPSSLNTSQQAAFQRLEIGESVLAKVVGKSAEDIQVVIECSGLHALLPVGHLTDGSSSKNRSLMKKIRVGEVMTNLAVIEKLQKQKVVILTNKPSLVKDAKNHALIRTFDDVKLNTVVNGYVRNITPTSIFIQFGGGVTGFLSKTKLNDDCIDLEDFGMKKFQSVRAKVISLDYNQRRFQLSLKDLSIECNDKPVDRRVVNPIDKNIKTLDDIVIGIRTKAKITSVKQTQINVQLGDNIKGRIDVSQIFDSWDSIKDHKKPLKSFSPRQILDVRVLGIHDARKHCFLPISHRTGMMSVFELTAKPSDNGDSPKEAITLDKIELKSSWIVFVNNVTDDCLWVNLTPNIRGRIAALDISDDVSLLENLQSNFPIGSALKAHVINIDVSSNRLDLSARPKNSDPLTFETLNKGMVVPGRVMKIDKKYLLIQLSDGLLGQVRLIDLADDFSKADTTKYFKNEIIRVCVCDIDAPNKKIRLSTRPSRVLNSSLEVQDPDISSIEQLKVNDVVRGFVKNISEKGIFVSLSCKVTAYVRVSDLSDSFLQDWKAHFQIDKLVKGKVISINQSLNQVQISLKESIFEKDYKPPITFENLKVGQLVTGTVRKVEEYGIFIVVDESDNVSGLCHRSELADKQIKDVKKLYEVGDVVKAIVLKLESQKRRVNFGLKTSYFEDIDSINHSELEDASSSSSAINENENAQGDYSSDTDEGGIKLNEVENIKDNGRTNTDGCGMALNESEKTFTSAKTKPKNIYKETVNSQNISSISTLDASGFDWSGNLDLEDTSSDDTSDNTPVLKKKKSKKASTDVDRTGDLDASGPRSVDDFERHLLGQPDSSELWIRYMAFHVQLGNLNEAREIAERAIRTINIREETEKLNIWVALLNLENLYGSEETIEEVFKSACRCNDAQEIHERFISTLIQSGKYSKADTLFQSLVKKFSYSPAVWYNYAHFLQTKISSPDRARALLPRAIQSLPPHAHLNLTVKFAALEFQSKAGSPERGRVIFEGLLSTFPKRIDIWSQLLDLEIQQGDSEIIRGVFQRVVKSKALNPKRAKTWFKKWFTWEEKYGNKKDCKKIEALAKEWVRKTNKNNLDHNTVS